MAEPVLVGARLTRAERARRMSLFLLLGASTTVCSRWDTRVASALASCKLPVHVPDGQTCRQASRQDVPLYHACARAAADWHACTRSCGAPTCVLVTSCTVVMQPCTMPSFSWTTCSGGKHYNARNTAM